MHRHPDLPKPFADLGLEVPILRALAAMGYKEPSPIQCEIVPLVLAGRDVLGQARTGTGKTAAFGMPALQKVDPQGRLQTLVLSPTRELAAQIVGEFRRIAQFMEIHCVPVYGGTAMKQQLHQLGRKPHVIVGTPGRVMDMLQRGAITFDGVTMAILDEVDRMLDIGFRDDIRKILGRINHAHQTVFVSATIDDEIRRLAMQYMKDPAEINVSRDDLTVEEVAQFYCVVEPWDKFKLLRQLLLKEAPKLAIVFTNTKHGARKVAQRLHAAGVDCREIHGDLVQQKRERIMERFKKHQIPVLVATDLAARGIDVHEITHIINYDLPQDIQIYVHRIGRTARMGSSGRAITFVTREQGGELTEIEMLINKQIAKLEIEGFAPTSPPRESMDRAGPHAAPQPVLQTAVASPAAAPAKPAAPAGPSLSGKFPLSRRHRRWYVRPLAPVTHRG
jgi:ATP-dependent RNA helicase DeaD